MRVAEQEAVRRSCYQGLRSIGPFVVERFIAIVKARNELARLCGFEDFYDMKVRGGAGRVRAGCPGGCRAAALHQPKQPGAHSAMV
jgi:hypothetical protein